jgi:hypothetical protein
MRLVLAMIGARIVLNGTEVRILCDDYAKLDWPIERRTTRPLEREH